MFKRGLLFLSYKEEVRFKGKSVLPLDTRHGLVFLHFDRRELGPYVRRANLPLTSTSLLNGDDTQEQLQKTKQKQNKNKTACVKRKWGYPTGLRV